MTRYRYNSQYSPPAPFVHVFLRHPDGTREIPDVPAQLDTGSDRSILPTKFVESLGLLQMGVREVIGFGGKFQRSPTFLVQIEIRNLAPLTLSVFGNPAEPFVILGRDVLNHFRLLLDGPQSVLEID